MFFQFTIVTKNSRQMNLKFKNGYNIFNFEILLFWIIYFLINFNGYSHSWDKKQSALDGFTNNRWRFFIILQAGLVYNFFLLFSSFFFPWIFFCYIDIYCKSLRNRFSLPGSLLDIHDNNKYVLWLYK